MDNLLTADQVVDYLSILTEEQKAFLDAFILQKRKSKWLEILSQKKGRIENLTDDVAAHEWHLEEVLEGPEGTRPYKCECGQSLRFQYVVFHEGKQERYRLGQTCLENYTGIPAHIVKEVISGINSINLERDEILVKVQRGDFFDAATFQHLAEEKPLQTIFEQIRIGLPLLDSQIKRLYNTDRDYQRTIKRKQIMEALTDVQKAVLEKLSDNDQEDIIKAILNESSILTEMPEGVDDKDIEKIIQAGLPLPERMKKRLLYRNSTTSVSNKTNYPLPWFSKRTQELETVPLTYDMLLERHLETLKCVRANEGRIADGLKQDWIMIQKMVLDLKNGEHIDYDSFRLNLNNLLNQLRIEKDAYL